MFTALVQVTYILIQKSIITIKPIHFDVFVVKVSIAVGSKRHLAFFSITIRNGDKKIWRTTTVPVRAHLIAHFLKATFIARKTMDADIFVVGRVPIILWTSITNFTLWPSWCKWTLTKKSVMQFFISIQREVVHTPCIWTRILDCKEYMNSFNRLWTQPTFKETNDKATDFDETLVDWSYHGSHCRELAHHVRSRGCLTKNLKKYRYLYPY